MAKNISLLGADYPDVPAVVLPKTGGGSAMFVDADDVNNVENALAIVVNGNTAPKAITAGQYLFIKNHSTLATGGYHATANISSGGAVSGSNVAADADGISNAINSKTTPTQITPVVPSGITLTYNGCFRIGDLISVSARLTKTEGFSSGTSLLEGLPLPKGSSEFAAGSGLLAVANNRNKNITIVKTASNLGNIYLSETVSDTTILLNCTYAAN